MLYKLRIRVVMQNRYLAIVLGLQLLRRPTRHLTPETYRTHVSCHMTRHTALRSPLRLTTTQVQISYTVLSTVCSRNSVY